MGFLGLLALGGYIALWLTAPKVRIDNTTYNRVRPGMTQEDVEQIFGGPPKDYSSGNPPPRDVGLKTIGPFVGVPKTWISDEADVRVWFDEGGKVTASDAMFSGSMHQGFFSRLRRLLGM